MEKTNSIDSDNFMMMIILIILIKSHDKDNANDINNLLITTITKMKIIRHQDRVSETICIFSSVCKTHSSCFYINQNMFYKLAFIFIL